jgi:hypothetical protein
MSVNALILSLKFKPQPQNSCQAYELNSKTMDITWKPSNSRPLWLVKPFIITENIFYLFNTYSLQYWTSNVKRRLEGSQWVQTQTSNSGGQPIHLKLETQPQDHLKTFFLNLKTQPQTLTRKACFTLFAYPFATSTPPRKRYFSL